MSWSAPLLQLRDLFQPDTSKNRILCAYAVFKLCFTGEISSDEANFFIESQLGICPVAMICIYKKWNTFRFQLEEDPDKLYRLVTVKIWDNIDKDNTSYNPQSLMLAF